MTYISRLEWLEEAVAYRATCPAWEDNEGSIQYSFFTASLLGFLSPSDELEFVTNLYERYLMHILELLVKTARKYIPDPS